MNKQRETLEMSKLYKTLFFLAIVVGPIYWLMFTDDGKRRTDMMVLWLAGGATIDLNFRVLESAFSERDWKEVYNDLDWTCVANSSSLGEKHCTTEIASYNGIPSNYLMVYFTGDRTSAIKLGYRDQYHSDIGNDLVQQLGQPLNLEDTRQEILFWNAGDGRLFLKRILQRSEDPVLLWVSAALQSASPSGDSDG
jgi:hypothetical protein